MAWMIPAAIAASAALNYLGGRKQTQAIEQASQAEQAGMANALALQREMWEAQQPWRDAGVNALAQMQGGGPDISQDPGYQFRLEHGQKAVERQLAGMGGGVGSGRAMKELTRFGEGLAAQEYGNAYNRLASLAGIGQTAMSQAQGTASNIGNVMMQQGSQMGQAALARGNQTAGMYNTIGNLGMQGLNLYQQQQFMDRMYPQTPAAPMAPTVAAPYTGQGDFY
jgi:hypothetical protein